jgi:hypothetical protein
MNPILFALLCVVGFFLANSATHTQRRVFVLSALALGKSVSEQLNIDQIDYSVGYGSQRAFASVNNMLMRQNRNFVNWKVRSEWI